MKVEIKDDDSSHPGDQGKHDLVDQYSFLLIQSVADRARVLSVFSTRTQRGVRTRTQKTRSV